MRLNSRRQTNISPQIESNYHLRINILHNLYGIFIILPKTASYNSRTINKTNEDLMKKLFAISLLLISTTSAACYANEESGKMQGKEGKMKGWFQKADKNNDGAVTKEEAASMNQEKFNKIDANKDGKITKEEKEAFHQQKKAEREEKHSEMLKKFDANKDGKLSPEERAEAKKDWKGKKEAAPAAGQPAPGSKDNNTRNNQ
jgi:Ca2+-binding EF-hand superfamily protein